MNISHTDSQTGDHPRSRGEHVFALGVYRMEQGSSPLSRGARSARGTPSTALRIIPALAGSTSTTTASTVTFRDHPRSRGEHLIQNRLR